MATTYDSQFIQSYSIPLPDQSNTFNDPLSVDVVALYIIGGDGQGEKLSDFVFQDQRQSPENAEDEPARNAPPTAPSSPDQLERGPLPPAPDTKAQPVTDKDAGPRKGPYLRPRRSIRRLSFADRKVNWLADGNGQLFRKAVQPLTMHRIIGVSIDLKRISNLNFAQVSREVGNEVRKRYESRPIVFLCHGFAAFYLKDVLEANQELDLRPAIAAIGMFGIDPKHRDITELRNWTAEKRCKMSPSSLLLKNNCQDDFGKALNSLLEAYFVSVFAFRTDPPERGRSEESKPIFSVLDSDPIWSGGGLDQMATFSGPEDAGFRAMFKYIIESVEGHQLLTAARQNDLERITTLIRRGTNIDSINYTSRDHKTALTIAAEAGHAETVEFLSTKDYVSLDYGVDVEKSALHFAVKAIKNLIGKISEDNSNEADGFYFDYSPAERILSRLKLGGSVPLDEMQLLDDERPFDSLVKQLARTMKVVEILLEAGALPSGGLVNTLNVANPLEKVVKQLLLNPPAVQGPSPRELIVSTPGEQAIQVCRDTPFVIREVFSVGTDKKDRYIPVYTDIHQVIYQGKSSRQIPQAGSSTGSPSDVLPPAVARSGPRVTFQDNDLPAKATAQEVMTLDTSEKIPHSTDQEFNVDVEFSRRKENFNQAGSQLLCRWYHIPLNNMAWVHDLFAKIEVHVWPWPQGYRDYKPRSRTVYPQFVKPKPLIASATRPSPVVHAIMIPYLSYEQSFRTLITGDIESRVSGPPDEDEDSGEVDEIFQKDRGETRGDKWMKRLMDFYPVTIWSFLQMLSHFDFSETYRRRQSYTSMWLRIASEKAPFAPQAEALTNAYLNYKHDSGYKLPLHPRLTLDQSHYYMLKDTTYRDRTQVVSRWFRRNRRMKARERYYTRDALSEEEDHNILMVDQLWIWLIENDESDHKADAARGKMTLVTSFPDRIGTKSAARNNIAQQVFRDSTRDSFRNVSDLVRQIISVCLRTLNEARVDGSVSFLQCFEISLGNLEERSGQSFLEFRRLSEFLEHLDEKHPDYLSRRGLLLKMLLRISKESRILSEVKDVLDEIGMIQGVLHDQQSVLDNDDNGEMDRLLGARRDRAPLYSELRRMIRNFEQMKQRAQSVVDSIEKLLDLKQKHANLWEARTSREGSDVAAKAGNTLWWFTAVTIIFLPLSFMASFFALDIDKFPKDNDGDTNWPLNTVIGLLFGISLAFIIPLYTLAFFSENLQRTWSRIRGIWMSLMELPVLRALDKLPFMTDRFDGRSVKNVRAVRKYDPKFERIIERMMGENGTEVINDDDLDEEDDLIREWRRYYGQRRSTF